MYKPRFTAEESLYATGSFYAAMATYAPDASGVVRPASAINCIKWCAGDSDCIQCCLCVRRGGNPTHCCI